MTKKIALFGGSFDPVHCGHLEIIHTMLSSSKSTECIVMPAALSPLKDATLFSKEQRLALLNVATKGYPVTISDAELDRDGVSYTVDTLNELKESEDCDISLWMGVDQFKQLKEWHKIHDVLKMVTVVVVNRGEKISETICLAYHGQELDIKSLQVVNMPEVNVSSSQIRALIQSSQPINGWVPGRCLSYIRRVLPEYHFNEVYGVSGRAGTGKTTFAKQFAEEKKALLIELDKIGHMALEIPYIQDELRQAFTDIILNKDKKVCRKTLGKIVFSDPQKLKQLNAIVHPFIKNEVVNMIYSSTDQTVVMEGALIEEIGLRDYCEHYWVLDTSEAIIHERAQKDLSDILKNQRSRDDYVKHADKVIS